MTFDDLRFINDNLLNKKTGEVLRNVSELSNEEFEDLLTDLDTAKKNFSDVFDKLKTEFLKRNIRKEDLRTFTIAEKRDDSTIEFDNPNVKSLYDQLKNELNVTKSDLKIKRKNLKEIIEKHGKYKIKKVLTRKK